MELVIPMYNVHPYFSLKSLGKIVCIIQCKIWCMCVCEYVYFTILLLYIHTHIYIHTHTYYHFIMSCDQEFKVNSKLLSKTNMAKEYEELDSWRILGQNQSQRSNSVPIH